MCSINHDLKAIYFHVPKTGGLFVENILERCYEFKTYYFTHEQHELFVDDVDKNAHPSGFINLTKKGLVDYYVTSKKFEKIANMNIEKWNSYYKFTFIREPVDRFISGYNYLHLDISINYLLDNKTQINNYNYFHLFVSQKDQLNGIKIDFIGFQENLNEDLKTILKNIGCDYNKYSILFEKKRNESGKKYMIHENEKKKIEIELGEDIIFHSNIKHSKY